MSKRELAEKRDQLPAVIDFSADAGVGVSGLGTEDIALPFIVILQKGSPQIDVDHSNHDQYRGKDFEVGDFFNTVTQESFKEIAVVNCGYVGCFVEWKPRDQGGGYVTQHPQNTDLIKSTKRNEKNQDVLTNGNLLVCTHYHYCLVLTERAVNQCVISMTSTQLKKSRRWNSLLISQRVDTDKGSITPARFATMWELSTVAEKNDQGTWRGFKIDALGLVTDSALYHAARAFNHLIQKGAVRVTPPAQEESATPAEVPY